MLYSRVLRDYLLYAADQEIVTITWSSQILAEVAEHLMANVQGFDHAAAQRLVNAMNRAFPYAEVEPDAEHWRRLNGLLLPDEDDRHVLAASLAAEANVLCTSNIKDFPADRQGPRLRGADSGPVAQSARGRVRAADAHRPPNGCRFAQGRDR